MNYTPTTWANGDIITAANLNKLEQGVSNSRLVVELTNTTGTADHTFEEIFEALRAGIPVYLHYPPSGGADWQEQYVDHTSVMPVLKAFKYNTDYRVYAIMSYVEGVGNLPLAGIPGIYVMEAASPSSYPVFLKVVYVMSNCCGVDEHV